MSENQWQGYCVPYVLICLNYCHTLGMWSSSMGVLLCVWLSWYGCLWECYCVWHDGDSVISLTVVGLWWWWTCRAFFQFFDY